MVRNGPGHVRLYTGSYHVKCSSGQDVRRRLRRHHFPSEAISHAVWLYHRFGLSLHDFENILAERKIKVTRETTQGSQSTPSHGDIDS